MEDACGFREVICVEELEPKLSSLYAIIFNCHGPKVWIWYAMLSTFKRSQGSSKPDVKASFHLGERKY